MKITRLAAMFLSLLLCAACAGGMHAAKDGGRRDVLYTCGCGPECKCNAMSTEPGPCGCGKPMKWGHVVRVEGTTALVCQCSDACACGGLDPQDPSRCKCGGLVKRIELKGSGLYFCNCGSACGCNTVSKTPGKCGCAMELQKAD